MLSRNGLTREDPGVVHEDVDPAEALLRGLGEAATGVGLADGAGHHEHPPRVGREPVGGAGELRLVPPVEETREPASRKHRAMSKPMPLLAPVTTTRSMSDMYTLLSERLVLERQTTSATANGKIVCFYRVDSLELWSAMTLDQLAAFHAVATQGTFSAASAVLHKSQPAVSKLVQNLELNVGLVLFDRSAWRATLTESGRLFFERTSQLLANADALRTFGRSLSGEAEPVVRLVVEAVTPLPPVLAALREVQETYPAVRYELRTERLTGSREALEDGSADLAIASADGMNPSTLTAHPFVSVRIVPVVRRDHPLAAAGSPVPAALLRQYAQVVLRDSTRGELTQTVNVLQGGLRWTVTDVGAKLEIIHAGMGWGGLPEHVVEGALRDGTLCALDVREFHVREFELSLLRRLDTPEGRWPARCGRGSPRRPLTAQSVRHRDRVLS